MQSAMSRAHRLAATWSTAIALPLLVGCSSVPVPPPPSEPVRCLALVDEARIVLGDPLKPFRTAAVIDWQALLDRADRSVDGSADARRAARRRLRLALGAVAHRHGHDLVGLPGSILTPGRDVPDISESVWQELSPGPAAGRPGPGPGPGP